jgi:hypothetical protein
MHPTGFNPRSWTQRLALSAACGLALATSASAQYAPPGFPNLSSPVAGAGQTGQSPKPLGTVLTVPLYDLGQIMAQNMMRQNNVNLLQVSQTAVGDMNTQVATVSILHHNAFDWTGGQPATTCWLPAADLYWVKQANKDTTIIEQTAFGSGNTQVAQVQVQQQNTGSVAPGTKYVLCPLAGVPAIQALNQKNVNVVHVSQLAIGDNNSQVALLSVGQQNAASLQVPGSLTGPLVQLNLNLNIITQVAIGNGNSQVATVDVGQSNSATHTGP